MILLFLLFILIWPFMAKKEMKESEGNFSVVVSNFALYDIVKALSSDIKVENILPFGSDIHTFEPTPKDIVKIKKADLFIYSGEELEPWISKFKFSTNTLTMQHSLKLKEAHEHDKSKKHLQEHAHEAEDHGAYDPHYWLDIDNMVKMVEVVAKELEERVPLQKEHIEFQKKAYIKQLEQLDKFYKLELTNCRHDTIVTNHNAFEYLADKYGFKIKAISGLSPEAQSSAHVMRELIEFVKMSQIKVLFFESFVSDTLMQTIAKESGVQRVEVLLPLANVTEAESQEGYITLMKQNAEKISYALECHNSMVK